MMNCSHCRRRKAKRRCLALGSDLCPLCCGLLREKELHCPPGCRFLVQHKPYQEDKIIRRKRTPAPAKEPQDERLNWLALTIEACLHDYAGRYTAFRDRDAVLALEYARDKTEKGRSRLLLTQEESRVKNEAGEAILTSLDEARFEKKIILPQDVARYSTDEKLKSLENVILRVKYATRSGLDGRAYLQDLARRMDRLKEFSDRKKVVSRP
jgi:hypothetical protein